MRRVARATGILAVCGAAWAIAFAVERSEPAAYDFIALYASAHLVATGHGTDVTDASAILAQEHAVAPERTALLNNPNPPALSLLLAPLGTLPFATAYAVMLTLGVVALAASAFLLADLAPPEQRGRLFPFVLLAPTSLIALVQGQTTPFVLLALAASLRASPFVAGLLLAVTTLRPQLLPLFAVVALLERRRFAGFLVGVITVAVVSSLVAGLDGLARYPALLGLAASELRPAEIGLPALARRAGVSFLDPALGSIALAALFTVPGIAAVLRARYRVPVAANWSVLVGSHVLLHDGLLAYPRVAARATTTRAAGLWVGSGVIVAFAQQAGLPIVALWLLALALWPDLGGRSERRASTPDVAHPGSENDRPARRTMRHFRPGGRSDASLRLH